MNKTKQLVIDAILLALLIISGKIVIPIGFLPFGITLQLIVVFLTILLNDSKNSLMILGTYLILGLVLQMPIFAYGGGISYIYNPSFGYLLGFIIMIFPIKLISKVINIKNQFIASFIGMLLGIIMMYLVALGYGIILYHNDNTIGVLELLEMLILPFVIIDIFKALVSSIIYTRVKRLL